MTKLIASTVLQPDRRMCNPVMIHNSNGYTVSDGTLVLRLEPAEEGGYVVTSPFDPELITETETLEEAFENARAPAEALRESRLKALQAAGAAR